ncbi:glycosyltransferase family 1 protein [Oceanobacillus piezotolerans]|uniref:Glycosyltransferase family 1 protein n=1 Tax=Oceanobacillus piezotolerans TaxID=2448030 RepID=A0A498DBA6_9BACI|nr:glycosyltransferase family 1 protein [Oceanobacillus piezotolerans]RLL42757.1 glycosyltransferase family 1 protein [Oceanobacillus piezotolerans]
MEAIRVLQVVTIMNRGGLETMLMNYYRHIDRDKIQFDFMVHRDQRGDYDDEIERLGGRIYRMPPIRPGNYQRYFKELDDFFAHHKYQVVHSHINENSSFVLRAAKKAGISCRIAHSHLSDLSLDYKIPFRLYARFLMRKNPTSYFACSKKAGEWLFGNHIHERLTVLNNAVDVNEFTPNDDIRVKLRKELNIEDKFVIGHVGRFNKQKNHSFLLEIFKEVVKRNPHAVLVLAGDGDLRRSIEEKVFELGLKTNVIFLGVRSNIHEFMQAFDIFLFPSLFEGLPVVLIEAQAAGLTCVVSNTITDEVDKTGKLQFVSLNETPEKWADIILNTTYEHTNTSKMLEESGYDISTSVRWLSNYYYQQAAGGEK